MRLQRYLALAGVASRRKAEQLIVDGRVAVNGRIVRQLGTKVTDGRDRIEYAGRAVQLQANRWLVLNKPPATVSSVSDPEGRRTVMDLLGRQTTRLYPVGRLDYQTQGALLLTNDGDLANTLLHPRNRLPRHYHVKLKGVVPASTMLPLQEGVTLDDGQRVKADVRRLVDTGKHSWYEVVLHQGVNRQIHRMMDTLSLEVLKLIRVSFGGITTQGLRLGQFRELHDSELRQLMGTVGFSRSEPRRTISRRHPTGRRSAPGPSRRSR